MIMKIQRKIQLFFSLLLCAGALSCSTDVIEGGKPATTFVLKGNVSDENGEPIYNVNITNFYMTDSTSLNWDSLPSHEKAGIYVNTAKDGSYLLVVEEGSDFTYRPRIYDDKHDGYLFRYEAQDPQYEVFDTIIPYWSLVYKGGDGKYDGGTAVVEINVVLKNKE